MITTEQIKALRNQTGMSIMQCKKALEEAGGDRDKALTHLKEQGLKVADKKADRALKSGVVSAYIHNNQAIGAMVELACETDFVAKNEDFKNLAFDLAMQVAAADPADPTELLAQEFIKDPSQTVAELIKDGIQKFGERIEIVRLSRLAVN